MTGRILTILFVGSSLSTFAGMCASGKDQGDMATICSSTPGEAWKALETNTIDILIADETVGTVTGESFVRAVIGRYPLINCALVSPLEPAAFHEATEGLGLFHHVLPKPGAMEVTRLLSAIDTLYVYLEQTTPQRSEP